ncbi:MAG: PQQ-dependent sugar dehydrogenase [Thermoanaerobaculia bacterium]|nr:PQQ-dependent sugar dehydrogenase [Thermoanaerobaculia bacterium]
MNQALLKSLVAMPLAGCFAVLTPMQSSAQDYDVTPMVVTDDLNSSSIGVTHAGDGSGRLFVVDQDGLIQIWDGAQVLAQPFLNISSLTSDGGEQGLLGLAFHPQYETNGFFYVNYTDNSGDTVVARYSVSGNPDIADGGSALQILTFTQPATNHNAGDMHFGPDGYLYISSGDGGANWCNSQDDGNLLGKILRIDVDNDDFPGDAGRNYAIPAGNPFIGVSGAAEEIWVMGLRNPWRFSFDRATGDMFIGDVGEGDWEEFDYLPAGGQAGTNMGWPWFEGVDSLNSCSDPPGSPFADCDDGPFTCPVLDLHRDDGACSAIGGFRYRGSEYPSLRGTYFFADWCQGNLHAGVEDDGSWTSIDLGDIGAFGPTGFGEDESGELYYVNNFRLLQITGTGPALFTDGFESGNTASWSATVD